LEGLALLSFELYSNIGKVLDALGSTTSLSKVLNELHQYEVPYLNGLAEAAALSTAEETWKSIQTAKTLLANIRDTVRSQKHRFIFSDIDRIEYVFEGFPSRDYHKAPSVITGLVEFANAYQSFLSSYDSQSSIRLISSALQLRAMLTSLQDTLVSIRDNLIPPTHVSDETHRTLSLVFYDSPELIEIARKLEAISRIYDELCILLNVSNREYPLEIVKLETGSLWLQILGATPIIGLFSAFIKSAAGYLYRNYTPDGKIARIPRKVEAIDAILGLSNRLKDANINTEEINDNIQKASILLSDELTRLMGNSPRVAIDGELISVGEELEQRYISTREPLLLEADITDANEKKVEEDEGGNQ
jgi:hypothetical protein